MEHGDGSEEMEDDGDSRIYLPGDPVNEAEELVRDESSYVLYHEAQTGSPCLSFDIIHDEQGTNRTDYPLSCYVVCGTQTDQRPNHVIVMKMSNLHKTEEPKDGSDDDSEEEEDLDSKPELETAMVLHHGGVNRVRCTKIGNKRIAATWSERNSVHLWDLSAQLAAVDNPAALQQFLRQEQKNASPVFTFSGHLAEGFAMDWSPTGSLLTGDCGRNIHLWTQQNNGWHVDQRPFLAHTDSVEDIQWSPNERSVFASCSVDKTIRIWDTRASPGKACMLTVNVSFFRFGICDFASEGTFVDFRQAHDKDVNVISWNKKEPFIVSGGDDGVIKIWDLRSFQKGSPIALFKHHSKPITSVEWHPTESSIFAAAGSDNQLTQWDLAVEPDDGAGTGQDDGMDDETGQNGNERLKDIPPQLLFIHQGQTDIKELHWHPQIPGLVISTALSGFNVFRTVSV